jgi:hypothetical protein
MKRVNAAYKRGMSSMRRNRLRKTRIDLFNNPAGFGEPAVSLQVLWFFRLRRD